jgi:c-di-GMP-binding flagellar brake protein YcgR
MEPPSERRDHARIKVQVPVELHFEDNDTPYRCATADLSLLGCYIESLFPFPVDTPVELKLEANGTLLILGKIVTCDPQVGNGIQFVKMLPEDIEQLRTFLDEIQKEAAEKEAAEREAAEKAAAEKKIK